MSVFSSFFNATYSAKQLRQLFGAYFWKSSTARPLGANSGVSPGTPSSVLTVSSTTWTLTPFTGVLDLETDATQGPSPYVVDANLSGAVTAADAVHDRIDLLSLTMDVGSSTVPHVVYTAGAPSIAPVPPATPANSIPLAQITVPKSGTGAPSFAWVAPVFTASAPKTCGQVTVACVGGTYKTQVIPFPPNLFPPGSNPIVQLTAQSANPDNVQAGSTSVSPAGFTLNVMSTTTVNRTINWSASLGDA